MRGSVPSGVVGRRGVSEGVVRDGLALPTVVTLGRVAPHPGFADAMVLEGEVQVVVTSAGCVDECGAHVGIGGVPATPKALAQRHFQWARQLAPLQDHLDAVHKAPVGVLGRCRVVVLGTALLGELVERHTVFVSHQGGSEFKKRA